MSRSKKSVPVLRVNITPPTLDTTMTERIWNMFKPKGKGDDSVGDKDMEKFQAILDDPGTTEEDLSNLLGMLRKFLGEIHERSKIPEPVYAFNPPVNIPVPMPPMPHRALPALPPLPHLPALPVRHPHTPLVAPHTTPQPNHPDMPHPMVPPTLRPTRSMPARLVHSSLPARSQPIHPSVPPVQHASISRSKSMNR